MPDTNNPNLSTADIQAIEDFSRVYGSQIFMEVLEQKNDGFFTNISFLDTYVHHRSASSEIIQSSQPDMHPKGEISLSGRVQQNQAIKGDLKLAPREYAQKHYLAKFTRNSNDPYDMPLFAEWVLRNTYARLIDDQESRIKWNGVFQGGPIVGFPNAAQDVADGILEHRRKAIVDGEVVPFASGAVTAANSLDKMEDFLDFVLSAPKYEGIEMGVFIPYRHLRWIRHAYRDAYGTYEHAQEYGFFRLDSHPNVRLIAQAGLARSSSWVATPSTNVFVGSTGSMSVNFERKDRYLDVLIDGKLSYDFADGRVFFTNDQA